jgi:hypothetical protein
VPWKRFTFSPHTSPKTAVRNVPATYTQYDDVIAILRVHYTLNNSYSKLSDTYVCTLRQRHVSVYISLSNSGFSSQFAYFCHTYRIRIGRGYMLENVTCFCFVEFSIYLHINTLSLTRLHYVHFSTYCMNYFSKRHHNIQKDFPRPTSWNLSRYKKCVYVQWKWKRAKNFFKFSISFLKFFFQWSQTSSHHHHHQHHEKQKYIQIFRHFSYVHTIIIWYVQVGEKWEKRNNKKNVERDFSSTRRMK